MAKTLQQVLDFIDDFLPNPFSAQNKIDLINDEIARGKILTYIDDEEIINAFLGLYHLKITEIGVTRIVAFTD